MFGKLLPIGIRTFSRLRDEDASHVDEAHPILSLVPGRLALFFPARDIHEYGLGFPRRHKMPRRQGSNPKRRIAPMHEVAPELLVRIESEACYTGSALHKRRGADYGFTPPANPRPHKSLCDGDRVVARDEARALFREGVCGGE